MPANARNSEEFRAVKKTDRTMNYAWMPRVNTEPKFADPWRAGKKTVFDLSKKLTDVIGDMVIYHIRLMLAKHRAMDKMDEETLMDYFSELQATAYDRTWKGIRNWKPVYGLNMFVMNQVRFAAMALSSKRKKDEEKGKGTVLVPSKTVSDMPMTFQESMELAERYMEGGDDSRASAIYEKICRESAADYDEDLDRYES